MLLHQKHKLRWKLRKARCEVLYLSDNVPVQTVGYTIGAIGNSHRFLSPSNIPAHCSDARNR